MDENTTQIYQIGVREENNTLTVYTPANTTSPNWDGSYAGRVGIGNTVPAHTLTVNGYNADSSGIAVYGAQAGLRFIDPEPTHPVTDSGVDNTRNLGETDPGADGEIGLDYPSERTYHIGSRNGSLVVAQQLGVNDTDIHDSAKAATLSVHANTSMTQMTISGSDATVPVTTHADPAAEGRFWMPPGLNEDHFSSGSVGINANNVPMASGLFVGDYSKAADDKRFAFTERSYWPGATDTRFVSLNGVYPTLSVLSGRPLSQANGAFKTVSVTAAITSNNSEASSPNAAGGGNIMKRIQGVRRFSEGHIAVGVNAATLRSDWRTVAWHDGIGIDDNFSVPMPAIGSEWMGTEPSDSTDDAHDIDSEATRVWWERRPNNINNGPDYQNQEYTESHLFGSSNNHVMTVHANTTYQGVHVEKGGIYANNSVVAWARIRPRGDVDALVSTETLISSDNYQNPHGISPATLAWDGHNIESIDKVGIGRFEITLPAEWRNGNNYSVMVTGTSNLFIDRLNFTELNDGSVSASDLDNDLFRRRQFESGGTSDPGIIGIASISPVTQPGTYTGDAGAISTHHVRVANDQIIQVETRTPITDFTPSNETSPPGRQVRNPSFTALIDEDEVYIVVIGSVDPTNFRG